MSERPESVPYLRQGRFCVECSEFSARLVMLLLEDGAPHGSPGHHLYYTRVSLSQCAACGMGLLERDAHECSGPGESLQRTERRAVWPKDLQRLLEAVSECTRPYDATCDCPLHKSLKASLKVKWTLPFDAKKTQEGRLPRIKLQWTDGLARWVF